MSKIYIGTSGYSYQDWVGIVYPAGTNRKDFLRLYACEFPLVELNFSYYKMPEQNMLTHMISATQDEFLFSIKAHKSLTHEIDRDVAENSHKFKESIAPLVDSKRIGAVLFQFPYSFHYTTENRKHLDLISKEFSGMPSVFEFRSLEWIKESVMDALRERSIGFTNVDEPPLPGLIPPSDVFTADPAYIRFHGRNKKNWWNGTNTTRYDYLYDEEELSGWISRIESIIGKAKILLIAFNNHYKGQAAKNAKMLQAMLIKKGIGEIRTVPQS